MKRFLNYEINVASRWQQVIVLMNESFIHRFVQNTVSFRNKYQWISITYWAIESLGQLILSKTQIHSGTKHCSVR